MCFVRGKSQALNEDTYTYNIKIWEG